MMMRCDELSRIRKVWSIRKREHYLLAQDMVECIKFRIGGDDILLDL